MMQVNKIVEMIILFETWEFWRFWGESQPVKVSRKYEYFVRRTEDLIIVA